MNHRHWRSAAVLAMAGVLALTSAACSSDSKSDDTTATTAAAPATEATSAATEASTAETEGSTAETETSTEATEESTPASDDTGTTTEATAESAPAGDDALGTPNPATGDPVKVGLISDGQSASIDNTTERLMFEASLKYANDYLGGVAGHVIDPVVCETKQDPAIAADCGNQMVQDGVVAVLWNVSGEASAFAPILQAASIPSFAWTSADQAVLTDAKTTFNLGNALAAFAFPAAIAKDQGLTKAAWLVIDVPSAAGPANALGTAFMKNAGVPAVDIVAIPPGTADMGPQVQAELSNGPELINLIGDAAFCTTALQALKDAGYEGTITAISNCIDENTISTIGDYLDGVLISYAASEDPTDPDYQTYLAVRDKYGDDSIETTGTPVGAFAIVDGFTRITAGVTGDVTAASITTAAKAAGPLPLPLSGGLEFNCDGQQIAITPGVCSSGLIYAALDAEGAPGEFKPLDATGLYSLG
jgi:branched-chain amino acid transport system substrate-binding protein